MVEWVRIVYGVGPVLLLYASLKSTVAHSSVSVGLGLSLGVLPGLVSGTGGNSAMLACANQSVRSHDVDVAVATIYPSTTILKIVRAQVAIGLLVGP